MTTRERSVSAVYLAHLAQLGAGVQLEHIAAEEARIHAAFPDLDHHHNGRHARPQAAAAPPGIVVRQPTTTNAHVLAALTTAEHPLSTPEIVSMIQANGWTTGSKSPGAVVGQSLWQLKQTRQVTRRGAGSASRWSIR